nr:unnamed protein product [Digitaria exilis]
MGEGSEATGGEFEGRCSGGRGLGEAFSGGFEGFPGDRGSSGLGMRSRGPRWLPARRRRAARGEFWVEKGGGRKEGGRGEVSRGNEWVLWAHQDLEKFEAQDLSKNFGLVVRIPDTTAGDTYAVLNSR